MFALRSTLAAVALLVAACSPVATPTATPPAARPTAAAALRSVTLTVPSQLRSARLQTPRQLNLLPGFVASVFAAGLPGARFMALGPDGTVYVSQMSAGKVIALPDRNRDGVADEVATWAEGLSTPHGLSFRDGYLYVAEMTRVVRFKHGPNGERQGAAEVVVPDLPGAGGHRTRTIGFDADGRLYVAVGSSCNVCEESDQRRAAISVYNPDGTGGRVFMRGLRNAVGFVWRPGTAELWATNNGRDNLGDDLPPEGIWRVRESANAGWPNCYVGPSGRELLPDPQFGKPDVCRAAELPATTFQAHSAPLGLRFYDGQTFPQGMRGDLFVALHGSWNRSVPVGYKVIRIPFANGQPGQPEDFATGWMADQGNRGSVWGRPVDLLLASDGAMLVSDDDGGAIYRIAPAAA